MGIEHMVMMAPLDPFFKPSYAMLDALFQRLIEDQVTCNPADEEPLPEGEEKNDTSFLNMLRPHPFPPNFTFPHPDHWTEETLALSQRLFEIEEYDPETWDYHRDPETGEEVAYYADADHLRPTRQLHPYYDKNFKFDGSFQSKQYAAIQPFIEGNYLTRSYIMLNPLLRHDLLAKRFYPDACSIEINCGFHCVENYLVAHEPEDEDLYFQCFPYAPKARWTKEHGLSPKNKLLLTYAGSFSMTLYFYRRNPLFRIDSPLDEKGHPIWPEGFTAVDYVQQFRCESLYYPKLKAAMECCFQTPVDVFVGVDTGFGIDRAWYT